MYLWPVGKIMISYTKNHTHDLSTQNTELLLPLVQSYAWLLLLCRLVVVMVSMIGSVIWIPFWIFFGVILMDEGHSEKAIIFFFVPVGITIFLLGGKMLHCFQFG